MVVCRLFVSGEAKRKLITKLAADNNLTFFWKGEEWRSDGETGNDS
jgi:hypothetical protein